MKILFMGTPDFAAVALKKIIDAGENVIGVITLPDRPVGRGYKLTPSAVKVCALEHDIPVYQPATLRGEEFAAELSAIDPELIIVAAYGKILPQNVLDYPKYGCINIHGSLLPEYRGAAPMQRAIIDGKSFTGITTMMMDAGIDTGDILLTEQVDILPEDNFETVHDKMADIGGSLMLKTIDAIRAETLTRTPQSAIDIEPTYAAKIEKAECLINFALDADTIHNKIRGLSPFPLSYARMPDGKMLKFVASRVAPSGKCEEVGKIVSADKTIVIACGDGTGRIEITRVLPEGKGRMDAADFLRGRKLNIGDILN